MYANFSSRTRIHGKNVNVSKTGTERDGVAILSFITVAQPNDDFSKSFGFERRNGKCHAPRFNGKTLSPWRPVG